MASSNARRIPQPIRTHEGGQAHRSSLHPVLALRRSVLSCFLYEDEFYEDGEAIAERIKRNVMNEGVSVKTVADLAIEARTTHHLRHVSLYLCALLADKAKGSSIVGDTIAKVIQRADEPMELMAIRANLTGLPLKKALTNQMRKGIARAILKFDAYQLAKWDRDGLEVALSDVIRLVHPRPVLPGQHRLLGQAVSGDLPRPDTWESALAAGADKKQTFTRLLLDNKLGYLALLRNLRGMDRAGVDPDLIRRAILERRGAHNVLPFRFVQAARACPAFEPELDAAIQLCIGDMTPLDGDTILLIDVSDSMNKAVSERPRKTPRKARPGAPVPEPLSRMDAAATLAALFPGRRRIYTFSDQLVEVPARAGMAGIDAIKASQPHRRTYLAGALRELYQLANVKAAQRMIVITDEETHDGILQPIHERAYLINPASGKFGVGYGPWIHIDGFSEGTVDYVRAFEQEF